ncbi:hypothetical protein [Sphingosinicella sp. CPCC 101087]|uniref:hypothetical protein n=1 Tax=Sphingosinicella sp. CPCC 101087 TaxID=2497754 RepID=UPI00101D1367|nr:hypothetical protein [Sphingosinicella sp. CPCC 101087]
MAFSTIAMLAYMFWRTAFHMRRDRIAATRELTRGKFAFRPKERARFLLNRAFRVSDEKAEWEDLVVSRLSTATRPTVRRRGLTGAPNLEKH